MSIQFEEVVEMADHLSMEKRLQLITHLFENLQEELTSNKQAAPADQPKRTFADFRGIMRGAVFNDEDFAAAEWHPTEEQLNSDYATSS